MGRAARKRPSKSPPQEDPFYIVASASTEPETRVLKHGDSFAVFDPRGDVHPGGRSENGLYHHDTRFLSGLTLRLDESLPLLLSSTIREDNGLLTVDLTNPDLGNGQGRAPLARGSMHLFRAALVWQGTCHQRLRVRNYASTPVETALVWRFEADFADIFEVRGTRRKTRGRMLRPHLSETVVRLGYRGLDGVTRHTQLEFRPAPTRLTGSDAEFTVALEPGEETTLFLTILCQTENAHQLHPPSYDHAAALLSGSFQAARDRAAIIETSNPMFNDWLHRSSADLAMMVSPTAYGLYPYAGVPWFSTAFGRDGLITAMECLWNDPAVARGVLAYLAATQAQAVAAEQDAEPGKILHETRGGEMAALGEVPFACYYGSVDSTPLFVMLASQYFARTGDREFLESIWPNLESALEWIDTYGDADRDGFVEYARRSSQGLVQQGWKDSHDSVFHADGSDAEAPIALAEVQAYVYAAKRGAAALASVLRHPDRAAQLVHQAIVLQERFEEAFWCPEIGTYALALDGQKQPCRVRSSNAGHCLAAGIASPEHAVQTAATLLADDSYSGWGIRTIAAGQARYNPMSYHNGSIWPHDNALVASGLARYGLTDGVATILAGLFDASWFFQQRRMPELFCGFPRRAEEGPTLYPVACSPQAWAAGAVFLLLQSCLGLAINAPRRQIAFSYPRLPDFLEHVWIRNLKIGPSSVDLHFRRSGDDAALNVLRREGPIKVVIVK